MGLLSWLAMGHLWTWWISTALQAYIISLSNHLENRWPLQKTSQQILYIAEEMTWMDDFLVHTYLMMHFKNGYIFGWPCWSLHNYHTTNASINDIFNIMNIKLQLAVKSTLADKKGNFPHHFFLLLSILSHSPLPFQWAGMWIFKLLPLPDI